MTGGFRLSCCPRCSTGPGGSRRLDPELRRLSAQAGGSRARWLAGLNPNWKFVTAHAGTDQDAWRLGSKIYTG